MMTLSAAVKDVLSIAMSHTFNIFIEARPPQA
jgi:hypothetical protein